MPSLFSTLMIYIVGALSSPALVRIGRWLNKVLLGEEGTKEGRHDPPQYKRIILSNGTIIDIGPDRDKLAPEDREYIERGNSILKQNFTPQD